MWGVVRVTSAQCREGILTGVKLCVPPTRFRAPPAGPSLSNAGPAVPPLEAEALQIDVSAYEHIKDPVFELEIEAGFRRLIASLR